MITKSGTARVRGQRIPSPPERRLSWLIWMAYSVMSGVRSDVVMIEVKNALMTESMEEVSGPFQSSHGGLGWLVGEWKRTSAERRCGSFCIMHWENRRRRVCWSEMLLRREEIFCLTSLIFCKKKLEANVADPTGWPRSLKPVVSSIGISGAFLSVGWGVVEDNAMDRDSDCASWGLSVVSVGRIDVPLHDVRILVLCGLTKQPMDAPCCLICVHKNSRSGRYTHEEISSTKLSKLDIPP